MSRATDAILGSSDYVWRRLMARIGGLSDEEYFWEPADGGWSLRRGADGVWRLDGEGGGGPAPDPVPVTSIAWRLGHIGALTLRGFYVARFADGPPEPNPEDLPGRAADAAPFLERQYATWRGALADLGDADWAAPLGEGWGPYADSSTTDLVLHVLDEVIHHGAEVGLLRDLFAARRRGALRA